MSYPFYHIVLLELKLMTRKPSSQTSQQRNPMEQSLPVSYSYFLTFLPSHPCMHRRNPSITDSKRLLFTLFSPGLAHKSFHRYCIATTVQKKQNQELWNNIHCLELLLSESDVRSQALLSASLYWADRWVWFCWPQEFQDLDPGQYDAKTSWEKQPRQQTEKSCCSFSTKVFKFGLTIKYKKKKFKTT